MSKVQKNTTITDANGHVLLNINWQMFRRLVIERFVPSSNASISIYAMVQRAADLPAFNFGIPLERPSCSLNIRLVEPTMMSLLFGGVLS